MKDRRSTSRRRVLRVGLIRFGGLTVDCSVRNLSNIGAVLDVDNSAFIPCSFTLKIPTENICQDCRVIWRTDKRIGLAFEQVARV